MSAPRASPATHLREHTGSSTINLGEPSLYRMHQQASANNSLPLCVEAFVHRSLVIIVQCLVSTDRSYAAPVLTHRHRRPLTSKRLGRQAVWLRARIPAFPCPHPLPASLAPASLACILGIRETDRNAPVPLRLGRILFGDMTRVKAQSLPSAGRQ